MLASTRARRFRQLYLRELGFVWTVLRRLGVHEAQVEDAAHDVFLVVHRQLDRFEARSSERTWLYAITRKVAWRYHRTRVRADRRSAALAADANTRVEPELDERLRRREATVLLHAFLETLDRSKREAFVLGELERLPRTSLGQALGVSPGTAYSRLRAARADFAAAFGPEGPRAEVLQRVARSAERPPRAVSQRLWLALPGGWLGRATIAKLVVGVAASAGVLGLVVIDRPARGSDPQAASIPMAARPAESASAGPGPVPAPSPSPSAVPEPVPAPSPEPIVIATPRASRARPVVRTRSLTDPELVDVAPSTASIADDALEQEAALLSRARAAMRAGRWDVADQRLREHLERFPQGSLRTEREVSAVRVACERGQRGGAERRAEALLSGSVSSSTAAALRRSCVADRVPGDGSSINADAGGDQGE